MNNRSRPLALYQLRKVTRVSAFIILSVIVVGLFLPTDYRVERSILIDAPQSDISPKMFHRDYMSNWMFIQNGQIDSFDGILYEGDSIGISYSETEAKGILSLLELSPSYVRFSVRPKNNMSLVQNEIFLKSRAGTTELVWVIEGKLKAGLLGPYIALFANDIAGSNFEKSLQQLKKLIER